MAAGIAEKNPSKDRSSLLWIILFLLLMAFFYWLDRNPLFQEVVVARLSRWTARGTVFILGLLGIDLKLAGTTITGPAMTLEIAASCSGSFVFFMFAAAVLPFPAPWKARLKGLFMGLLTLLLVNLIRTSLIVLVVSRFPGSLWTFHIVIGQVLVIVSMMGVFLWWSKGAHRKDKQGFFRNNRAIFRFILLFALGYLAGYGLYQVFLESPLGLFVNNLIESHLEGILHFIQAHISSPYSSRFAPVHVTLVEGCLSSPMVVLLAALVFAWPARWWKRLLVIFLGFIPFFYGYHLVRAVLVAMTLGIQSKEMNLVYNFYGQVFLFLFLLAALAYYRCAVQKSISPGRFLQYLLISCLIALPLTFLAAWVSTHWLTPWLVGVFSGGSHLSFDPEQAVSTMLPVWTFIWLVLIGITPAFTIFRKTVLGISGLLAATVLYGIILALFETFQMAPHKGLLKLLVILLPFGVYGICCLRGRKNDDGPVEKKEAEDTNKRTAFPPPAT